MSDGNKYHILSVKWSVPENGRHMDVCLWWNPNSAGYTTDVNKAGVYSEEQAMNLCRVSTSFDPKKDRRDTIPVRVEDVQKAAYSAVSVDKLYEFERDFLKGER